MGFFIELRTSGVVCRVMYLLSFLRTYCLSLRSQLVFVLGMLALFMSAQAVADEWRENALLLEGGWQFHQTFEQDVNDIPQDAQFWQDVRVPSVLTRQPNEGILGLYRIYFDKPVSSHDLAVYIESIRHADAVYVNRHLIGATGQIDQNWDFRHNNPQSLPRLYDVPEHILQKRNNELIIKTNMGFGSSIAAIYPGATGLLGDGGVYLAEKARMEGEYLKRQQSVLAIDAVFITLGAIDLLLIVMLVKYATRHSRELVWLILSSVAMLLAAGAHDIFYAFNIFGLGGNRLYIVVIMLSPILHMLFFWEQRKDIPMFTVWCVAGVSLLITAAVASDFVTHDLKNVAWNMFMIVSTGCYAYCVYAAIRSAIERRTGSALQLLGLMFYLLMIRTQWLPDGAWGHRNVQIGSLVFRYAIFFSYVLIIKETKQLYEQSVQKILEIDDRTRTDIAMELHDGITQKLASIKLLGQLIDKDHHSPQTQKLKDQVDSAIRDVRNTIENAHDASFEKYSVAHFLRQDVALGKIDAEVELTLSDCLEYENAPPDIKKHAYHIVHECLINAQKHANAQHIDVSSYEKNDTLFVSVVNDGDTFPQERRSHTSGYGWTSIQERLQVLRGDYYITTDTSGHTKIVFSMPCSNFKALTK